MAKRSDGYAGVAAGITSEARLSRAARKASCPGQL